MDAKTSADFVALLKELHCPQAEKLEGHDIDWLWETPAKKLLEWICNNVSESNCLTEDEVKQWAKIPKENVLTGEKLERALENLEEEDKLPRNLDEARDELELRQACINDLKRVKSNLSTHQGRAALTLSQLEKKIDASQATLSSEQKKLLRLNSDVESALRKLKLVVDDALKQDTFLALQDFSPFLQETEQVRQSICQIIHKRFDNPLGRDLEEFDALVSEIHRLRFSIQNLEQKRIVTQAKAHGLEKSLEDTKSQLKLHVQGMLPVENIPAELFRLEKEICSSQKDAKTLIKDVLPQVIEERVANQCNKILREDLKAKLDRQNYVIEQLETILDLLLQLTASQELLGCYMAHETQSLDQLETVLLQIQDMTVQMKENAQDEEKNVKELLDREALMKRNTIVPWDKGLLLLFKMLTGKDTDPSMITYEDIKGLLEKMVSEHESLEEMIKVQTKSWTVKRDQVRSLLEKVLTQVGITDDSKGYNLSSHETRHAIKSAQAEMSTFEAQVKDAIYEWEKGCNNVKENPLIKMEKGLWKDFMNNPTAMEKTVETMKSLQKKKSSY